jgi:hypothetical protein
MRGMMFTVILLGIGSLASAAVAAAYAVRTGDLCALAAQVWDNTKEGATRAADLDKAAHVEYETAYLALSIQNIFERLPPRCRRLLLSRSRVFSVVAAGASHTARQTQTHSIR